MSKRPFRSFSWQGWLVLAVAFTGWGSPLRAQEPAAAAPLPPVIARYEQMLAASPGKGTAFDKVYQHFFEGEGLDKLAVRWEAKEGTGGPNAESYALLRGLLNERRAKPADARENYTRYTAAHPRDPRGWIALGELETSEGRAAASAAALAKALGPDMQPPTPMATRPTLYRELARAQTRDFQVPAALETWRQLLKDFPDDASVLDEVGEAFQEAEAYDEARGVFEKRRDLARANGDAFGRVNATLRLGQIEEARGKAPAAVAIYEGVVSEAKAGSWLEREARARIEQLYRGQEDLPGLADYYKKWLADHPKDVEVATRRAAALIELNHKPEAIDLLKEATAWAPDRADLQVELAQRLDEVNRPAEAAAVMEKLTAAAPEERSYWQLLGDARWQLMETTEAPAEKAKLRESAITAWKNLAPAGSKEVALIGQLADLFASHRLNDEALAEYARAVAVAPDLPDGHERQADFLGQLGRADEARAALAGVIAGKNATGGNYLRLSNALSRLEDAPGALEAARKGLEIEPANFDLLSTLWQLLSTAKRWEEAAALYDRSLAAAPNSYFAEQVQARHVGALASLNKLDETRLALLARLERREGDPAPAATAAVPPGPALSEAELALLARIDLQSGDNSRRAAPNANPAPSPSTGLDALLAGVIARRALEEGRRRFPQSVALTRLAVEISKRVQDVDGQVAALRRLIELQPTQKADGLREISRAYQDAGRGDEALAAANEVVAASPANVTGYLLLADLLLNGGRSEEGLQRLRDAVKLSDKPNDIRQRLARAYLDLSQTAKAREVYEEAFEAAANAQERLSLMKPLTDVYVREGKVEELIERFQHRQQAEADGWRYALYLAEIYHETLNYTASRRELTKALAARPKDGGLLRQLVRVADEEQNSAEVVRFQTLLAEAEPSAQNQLALVMALLNNTQPAEALSAIRRNLPALQKMPNAWGLLLPQLVSQDLVGKVSALLVEALGADRDGKSRFTVATFQASGGEYDAARETLWSIFQAAPGNPPPPPPAPNPSPNRRMSAYGGSMFYGSNANVRAEVRINAASRQRDSVQSWLSSSGGRSRSSSPSYSVMPAGGNALSASLELADSSLITLAAIAIKQNRVPEFLTELEKRLDARDCSHLERLIAYSILELREKIMPELAALAAQPETEEGLDHFCAQRLFFIAQYDSPQSRRYYGFPALTDEQKDTVVRLFDLFLNRLAAKEPEADPASWAGERYALATCLERKEDARASRQILTDSVADKPEERLARLTYFFDENFTRDDLEKVHAICQRILANKVNLPAGSNARTVALYLPVQPLQSTSGALKLPANDLADLMADLLMLWYPAKAPPAAVGGASLTFQPYGNQPGTEEYLPPTRFIDADDLSTIEQMASSMENLSSSVGALMPRLRERLNQHADALTAERRIYPRLLQVYLDAYGKHNEPALEGARKLLAENENDEELRLLVGTLLGRNQQYAEALALLNRVNFRYGQSAIILQQQILTFAQAAKDQEAGRRAALLLAGLRLPPQQRSQLVQALQTLGLKDKAEQLARSQGSSRGQSSSSGNQFYTVYNRTQEAIGKKDEAAAIAAAQALLSMVDFNNPSGDNENQSAIQQAASVYRQFRKRDVLLADLEKQVAQEPGSVRLHYILANIQQEASTNLNEEPAKTTKLPVWVKLTRTGKEYAGFYSEDGAEWKDLGHAEADLGEHPLAALAITSCDETKVGSAAVENVELSPVPAAPAPAAADAAPSSADALPTPWLQKDILSVPLPSEAVPVPPSTFQNNVFTMRGAGANFYGPTDSGHLVYRPLGEATTFVARLVSYQGMEQDAKAGIMFRADLSPGSPTVAVVMKPTGRVGFRHRDGLDLATVHWRKLVELRPKEMSFQLGLASRLAKTGAKTEAVAMADQIIAASPDDIFTGYNQGGKQSGIIDLYKATGNFERLVNRVLAWQPGPPNPNNPYYSRSEPFFQLLVKECIQQKQYDQAIALCRRGVAVDTYGDGFNLRKSLYETLQIAHRDDEARAVVVEMFRPPKDSPGSQPRVQLGFRNQMSYSNTEPAWRRNVRISSEDGTVLPVMGMLDDARRQGWLRDVTASMEAQVLADKSDPVMRQMLTLLRIMNRDPRGAEDIAAMKAALPLSSNGGWDLAIAAGLLMYDAEEFKRWPGQEGAALDALHIAQRIADADRQGTASYYRSALLLRLAETEINFGQLDAAAATLHQLSGVIKALVIPGKATNSNSGNNFNASTTTACLELMLRAGAGAQADFIDLLAAVRVDSRMDAIPFSYDLERDLYTGQGQRWQAYGWLLDTDPAAAESQVVYEARVEHPHDHKGGVLYHPTTRARAVDASDRERTLIFSYGRTPEALAPIGRLTTHATHGVWTGQIPPGAGYLQVSIEGMPDPNAAVAAAPSPAETPSLANFVPVPGRPLSEVIHTPAGTLSLTTAAKSPALTTSNIAADKPENNLPAMLHVVRNANLIRNPGFNGLSERKPLAQAAQPQVDAKSSAQRNNNEDDDANPPQNDLPLTEIDGWSGLPGGFWRLATEDGPLPGKGFVIYEGSKTQPSRKIVGARIAIQPGRSYFQSVWFRDRVHDQPMKMGRRYLNAEGKLIKETYCYNYQTMIWRWQSQRLMLKAEKRDDTIPPDAAFIEPFIEVKGGGCWAGAFIGEADAAPGENGPKLSQQ